MHVVEFEAVAQFAGPVAHVVTLEAMVNTFVPEHKEQVVEFVQDEQLVTVQLVEVLATQAPDTNEYPDAQELMVKVDPDIEPYAALVAVLGIAVQAEALG